MNTVINCVFVLFLLKSRSSGWTSLSLRLCVTWLEVLKVVLFVSNPTIPKMLRATEVNARHKSSRREVASGMRGDTLLYIQTLCYLDGFVLRLGVSDMWCQVYVDGTQHRHDGQVEEGEAG